MPIESMYGMVYHRAGYYIRRSPKGKLYSCRCPDRSGHVKLRAKDLNKMTQDQAAFAAQKDLANGKKTMKAYLWKVCGAEYDQQHG